MTEQLAPCPACGSKSVDVLSAVDSDGYEMYIVVCLRCDCEGLAFYDEYDAIASWNAREGYQEAPDDAD